MKRTPPRHSLDFTDTLFGPAEDAPPAPAEADRSHPFNYFNYFTEIEDAFVARRGSPMMISPMDWSLVESWKTDGIPLHIVLRGIAQTFDKRAQQALTPKQKIRKINSLLYCQQAVMEEFADYCESRVGAASGEEGEPGTAEAPPARELFPRDAVRRYLDTVAADLVRAQFRVAEVATPEHPHQRWAEALDRSIAHLRTVSDQCAVPDGEPIDFEQLEKDLTWIEDLLYEALRADASPVLVEEIVQDGAAQLKPHKKRMDKAVYQQTLDNYVARLLRERYGVPRLSLFYLNPE